MRSFLRTIVALIAVAMIGISCWNLYQIHAEYSAAEQIYEDAAEQYVQTVTFSPVDMEVEGTLPEETEPREYAPISVDFEALWQQNEHVVGWIYCPDTVINYPIVQTGNNTDFIRRALDGSYLSAGTIFLDYRNNGEFLDANSVIYGHNMKNNSMFGTFDKYKSGDYYTEHPVFYLLTPQADYRIDLIAGLTVNSDSDFYRRDHDEESFREFLEDAVEGSTFVSGVELDTVERVLTLSTCSYEYDTARYILIGAMTELDRPETE